MKDYLKNLNIKEDITSIPNLLSLFRLFLIFPYLIVILNAEQRTDFYLAAAIIVASGLTDFLDGYVARNYNQITNLGKVLDPVADKLTQLALAFSLIKFYPEMLLVALVLVGKECFMLITGIIFINKGLVLNGAKWFGKIATASLYIGMFGLLIWPHNSTQIIKVVVAIMLFFLCLSWLLYAREYILMYRKEETK